MTKRKTIDIWEIKVHKGMGDVPRVVGVCDNYVRALRAWRKAVFQYNPSANSTNVLLVEIKHYRRHINGINSLYRHLGAIAIELLQGKRI